MAASDGRLTTRQKVRLANAVSGRDMETIALGYLGFEDEEIKSLIDEHKSHAPRINRDILQKWCNKNSGKTQIQVILPSRAFYDLFSQNPFYWHLGFTRQVTGKCFFSVHLSRLCYIFTDCVGSPTRSYVFILSTTGEGGYHPPFHSTSTGPMSLPGVPQ